MLWQILFALAVIFVLTYNPNSRTLETFINRPIDKSCEPSHFEAVQFAKPSYTCPPPTGHLGATT
jgi:hypothetical protein